jgi:hypothetical protein
MNQKAMLAIFAIVAVTGLIWTLTMHELHEE